MGLQAIRRPSGSPRDSVVVVHQCRTDRPNLAGRGELDPVVVVASMLAVPGLIHMDVLNPNAWSLSYEESFYLTSAVGWRFRDRAVVLLPLALLAGFILLHHPRWGLLLVGVVCRWYPAPIRSAAALIALPALLLAADVVAWAYWPCNLLAWVCGWIGTTGLVNHRIEWLRLPPIQFLGTISYSFYLWQFIVLNGLSERWPPGVTSFAVFCVVATFAHIGVSWLSYRVIEEDVGRFTRRFLGGEREPNSK